MFSDLTKFVKFFIKYRYLDSRYWWIRIPNTDLERHRIQVPGADLIRIQLHSWIKTINELKDKVNQQSAYLLWRGNPRPTRTDQWGRGLGSKAAADLNRYCKYDYEYTLCFRQCRGVGAALLWIQSGGSGSVSAYWLTKFVVLFQLNKQILIKFNT